jgi:hypothetical protein
MFSYVRTKIKEALETIAGIGEVSRVDKSTFERYPAVVVTPSQNLADYNSTIRESNKETYIFTLKVLYPFTEGQETADLALDEALDKLIVKFRDRTVLGDEIDWVEPVPSIWGYQDRPDGRFRAAELTIRAVKFIENGQ